MKVTIPEDFKFSSVDMLRAENERLLAENASLRKALNKCASDRGEATIAYISAYAGSQSYVYDRHCMCPKCVIRSREQGK